MFRFVNLYGRRVEARTAVGQHLTCAKTLAMHVRGLITKDEAAEYHWSSPEVCLSENDGSVRAHHSDAPRLSPRLV